MLDRSRLCFGRPRKNDRREHRAQIEERLDRNACGPDLHRRACGRIHHPPGKIARHPRQPLDAHHLLAAHALAQLDDDAPPMQRVPPVVDRAAIADAVIGADFGVTGSVCIM